MLLICSLTGHSVRNTGAVSLFRVTGLSYLGDGDVGLEALDFHIVWFDRQVGLAMGDVQGAGGRALRLGQLVLLLACLALCGSRSKGKKKEEERGYF